MLERSLPMQDFYFDSSIFVVLSSPAGESTLRIYQN